MNAFAETCEWEQLRSGFYTCLHAPNHMHNETWGSNTVRCIRVQKSVPPLLRIREWGGSGVGRATCRPARAQRECGKELRGQGSHEEVPPLCSRPALSSFSSNCANLKSRTNPQMAPVHHHVGARAVEPQGRHLCGDSSQPSPGV